MKKILLLLTSLSLTFCSSKKEIANKQELILPDYNIESLCPSDGKCTIEILRNKSLEIKKDEFGSLYYQVIETLNNTSVIVYKYDRNVPKELQDGNYREEIIFEIKNSDTNLVLSEKELQTTKMIFGRFCYCKGQTGYYLVENGNLNLSQKDNKISFSLDFTITKVPQIIRSIKATLQ
ncbi:hypothetical protein OX283_005570 [Flavobacterium sp. SUN052]|uniref:hypothetical protein n=1 Tax=Flavobacterium sp. SUN052 TaxID=3002441 RepID=UPI00237EB5EA|nr:hypothetical protein [Flavobacterium sp. SUN052]MEC4004115.1 hypothetical protein [Flavobacterium sp. SUN052]